MIKIFGIDVYYVVRSTNNVDTLFDEAAASAFNVAVPIEMYIESYDGFKGDGDLLGKFGLNVADQLNLSVARLRFQEDIGTIYNLSRPREGDLVYFPLTNGCFEIKFVEHEENFYQTGALQFFQLNLEKFNYNSETFNTGIPNIDAIQQDFSVATDNYYILTEAGYYLQTQDNYSLELESYVLDEIDPINQNEIFTKEANLFIDFSITNPFGEIV